MSDESRHRSNDRLLEILAVIMLGVATVGSAWCGYQASQWNGEESSLERQASDQKLEGARLFGLATQKISYDANVVGQYAQAYQSGDENLQRFIRASLVRPKFLPKLDEWLAEVEAGNAPANLLTDETYLNEQLAEYQAMEQQAAVTAEKGNAAGRTSDDYVLTTLAFAVALFFAGVAGSFKFRSVRLILLLGAAVTIGLIGARLVDLPVVN